MYIQVCPQIYTSLVKQIYTVWVHDAHSEDKTADKLLEHLLSVIEEVETAWGCHVVAVCSDASGESQKAQRLLQEKFPHLVTPDCYAHQVCKYFYFYFLKA